MEFTFSFDLIIEAYSDLGREGENIITFENIRNLREDHDKTQRELAEYLNVKQTTYSKYELGKINIPIEVLVMLADYYDVTLDYLLGRTTQKK